MKHDRSLLGIIFMIAGTFSLGTNDILVKSLTFKFPIWEIVFFSSFERGYYINFPFNDFWLF